MLLNDFHLVSSLKVDSLDWYCVSDASKIIKNNKKANNYYICLAPHSKKSIAMQFRSIKKIKYETFKSSFLTDTLTFYYRNNLSNVKLMNGYFKESPMAQRLGWR